MTGRRPSNPLTNEARKLPAAKFTAKVRADVIATTDYVKKNLQNKEIQFLDSRTVKEYTGDDIRALRGGYIAAANHVNIPYEYAWKDPETAKKLAEKTVKDREGMALKDAAGIKELYKGLDPKKEVVAYCQTGTRSTQTYAVLREAGVSEGPQLRRFVDRLGLGPESAGQERELFQLREGEQGHEAA